MRKLRPQLLFLLMLLLFWGMGQSMSHAACATAVCLTEEQEAAPCEAETPCCLCAEHRHHSAQVPNWRSEPQGFLMPQALEPEAAVSLPPLPQQAVTGLPRAPSGPAVRLWCLLPMLL